MLYPLILASSSPRRKELLALLDIPFTIQSSDTDESLPAGISPERAVLLLAKRKAEAVQKKRADGKCLILSADTVVAYQGNILGKPKTEEEAFSMLSALSGNTHSVYTGVCLDSPKASSLFYVCTKVTFFPLSSQEIRDYIATGEPMDKAGAYGIQGRGSLFVQKICGDYFNVVGLPIARVKREILKLR